MTDRERVREKMAEVIGRDRSGISDDAVLTDLVTSSFLLVEMVIELQEEFDVRFQQSDMNEVRTVGALLDLVDGRMTGNASG